MAEKTLNTRQKQKYDTSTNWTTNNPVLLAGELGFESDTNKFKIGNGTSAWNELDYVGSGEVMLYSTTGQNTDGAMTQKAVTDSLPQAVEIEMNMETGQATVTVEQFEKLLESPENYIVVTASITDTDGSITTESIKFIRGSYRKAETSSYWVEHLLFNSVNTGDTEKTPYMYLILARHSISPNDIGIGMGGEEYATVNQLNNKVDKVTNMGLSTNDYTTADKNKLAGIEAGAEVNTVTSVNGKTGAITLSADDVNALPNTTVIPTALSDLTSDITHRTVTDIEKSTWNAKSDFSGSYNDLTDKPTISTINVDSQPQSTINFDSDPQTQITQNTQDIEDLQNEKIQSITLTASQGTLTDEQFNILTSSDKNYIVFTVSGSSTVDGSYQRMYKLYRGNTQNYATPTIFTRNSLNYFSGLYNGFYYSFSVNPDTKQYSITQVNTDTVREEGEVERGTSGQNGYYHYWYRIYHNGKIEVNGVYYTHESDNIKIPFTDFAFNSLDYFRCAFGSVDNAAYTNGAYSSDVQTTYITFTNRSKSQWYSFFLFQPNNR